MSKKISRAAFLVIFVAANFSPYSMTEAICGGGQSTQSDEVQDEERGSRTLVREIYGREAEERDRKEAEEKKRKEENDRYLRNALIAVEIAKTVKDLFSSPSQPTPYGGSSQ